MSSRFTRNSNASEMQEQKTEAQEQVYGVAQEQVYGNFDNNHQSPND